ncbi:DHH family phosphoesterase [Psychromonas algicola]|uniref:DHH family phosphoesterase n=1 Tax=Psychromonas algicola TaxID=2555642 RepID=UPI0010680EC9|nr:DHH family phosphoesterase [Psychromonas sp. RZ5]TEW50713.1 DHH family phosphoesterase [Psychromonas sp. RZ5]
MHYDIFNGDADGIISLLQLRLSSPLTSTLVTGVKRNIQLLQTISVNAEDSVTVLDISMEKNIEALLSSLNSGATVFYADHHRAGDIPQHKNLTALIDLDANTCTALIVDKHLKGEFHDWAICAAYGDNLIAKADALSAAAGHTKEQSVLLKELGTLINYNGYGANVADLHFDPADLYQALLAYASPFDVFEDKLSPFYQLQTAYQEDLEKALAIPALHQSDLLKVFELPDEKWSRRISGVYGNLLANQEPNSAFTVLTKNTQGGYLVSLRAPLNNKQGAGELCSQFETGGGRAAAAGVNHLPTTLLQPFIDVVEAYYHD